ncbi:ferritin-like domain-containing protein [Campylobacter sp. faydin G-24]|uniref:Ferritin-like domain-containing protein n=1 Tax=Campylobacter anatolicus TaxID=2829105 RepID=A0ABS5HKA5_9BACT|nr:ferritin-like domain-containing protein [Campylobacter anatolicus]MBR8463942.1 ferritin-like domain-containing protein [Campylobacter anatolicus]
MDFFNYLFEIINESNINVKFDKFKSFYDDFMMDKFINFTRKTPPIALSEPCYAKFCEVVEMKQINKKSKNKQLNFIHSIAHIEFSAIDIALDACYHFDALPKEYYYDWLKVADDEIRHFLMINALLEKMGAKYGDMQVHNGLFIALQKTQNSLIQRMALLPRYMEANGLDANFYIINKLKEQGGDAELIAVLQVILDEEVSHVSCGDKWFKFACKRENIDPNEYINIVQQLYPNSFKTTRNLNEADRIKAGFSVNELEKIKSFQRNFNE